MLRKNVGTTFGHLPAALALLIAIAQTRTIGERRPLDSSAVSTEAIMTKLGRITPILRIFDEAMAREFYVDFLGFKVDWEHRFEPDLPLYMQVSKDDCIIHLSEHFGDGSPGVHLRIEVSNVDEFQQSLIGKRYKNARPGVEDTPWGSREMTVLDPAGNSLTFATAGTT
jgi:catechol 2,3-dioxygenase-like lactoylglutathione lyase family enzyme